MAVRRMERMENDIQKLAEVSSLWKWRNGPARGAHSLKVELIVRTAPMLWIDGLGIEEDVDGKEF